MGKWYGVIGYAETVETEPGIWTQKITEHNYYGDLTGNFSRWSASSDSTNDDLQLDTKISIVADPFAYQNFHAMKYVEYMGAKWKISNVEPQYPRLILAIGGVYNG